MTSKTGVLLVNLGTPLSPSPKDVYRYLIEFLSDERVIDEPWLKRQLLVRGIIVPFRYRQSAASYQAIWTKEGSPLMVYGRSVQRLLQESLGEGYQVELAMRYQVPSIPEGLKCLTQQNINRLVIFPLFPQYASATTGSVHQRVMECLSQEKVIPKVTFIDSYAEHPKMLEAYADNEKAKQWKSYDHILFSFHGLPLRQLIPGSPQCYLSQCQATAKALGEKLGIPEKKYTVCFQSRLGKQPWIQPYTSDCIKNCAAKGDKRILVFCTSFVCDCLETIHEIGVEYAEEFKTYGGEQLDLAESLNSHPLWIEAIRDMITKEA